MTQAPPPPQHVFSTIRYEIEGRIAVITLARPEKRNAMNVDMFRELGEATAQAAGDPAVRGVLMAGEGRSFCAGIDLAALAELGGLSTDPATLRQFIHMAQRPIAALAGMPKPTIAAVHGYALGAGFQLALACDLRAAATDACFGMLEARYGLIPDMGGAHRLARLVGPATAKEVVWSTRRVEAKEAERIGLVNRVMEPSQLAAGARALLAEVTEHTPVAVGLAKALIDRAHETPLETQFEREADAQVECIQSDDHVEAVSAYVERRPPRFVGH
jgi:enoyl-CoA hydratase/carnithine racemase